MAQDLSKQYQKKTDKQHILDNPDTYIGAVDEAEYDTYIYNSNKTSEDNSFTIVPKNISIIPWNDR